MRRPGHGPPFGTGCPCLAQRGHGSWYVTLELPPAPDGRRRRIRRGGYPTRHAARQAVAQLRTPGPAGSTTIATGQWLDRWQACRTSPASSTVRAYTAKVQAMFTAIIRQHQATGHPVTPATLAASAPPCAPRSAPPSAMA